MISRHYLNNTLIPLLCREAGIPASDARGTITTHGCRATTLSKLYHAKDPMSPVEIKDWVGHKDLSSTQRYLLASVNRLAKKYVNAQHFEETLATWTRGDAKNPGSGRQK